MFFDIESIYRSAIIDMKRRRARYPLSFFFITTIATIISFFFMIYAMLLIVLKVAFLVLCLLIIPAAILTCALYYLIYWLYTKWARSIVKDFEEKTYYVVTALQQASKKDCLSVLNAELEMFNPYHALAWRNLFFIYYNTMLNVFGLSLEGETRIISAMTKIREAAKQRVSELESKESYCSDEKN